MMHRFRMNKPLKNHEAHLWEKGENPSYTDQTDGGDDPELVQTCQVTLFGSVTHTFSPNHTLTHQRCSFHNGSLKCEKKKTLPTWCAILPLSSAILRGIHFLFTSCAMLDEYGKCIINNQLEKKSKSVNVDTSYFILPLLY